MTEDQTTEDEVGRVLNASKTDDSEDRGLNATPDEDGQIPNPTKPEDSEGDYSEEPPADDDEPETFPREYVEKLRDENAKYRQRAQRSDELAHRLHRALVEADGRLADPTDLEFTEDHLEDAETLSEAIGELLRTKPHLAARRPAGDIGQGASGANSSAVDLAGLLRAGAN